MDDRKHIVIVGGGFAGLRLVKELDRGGKYRVTLVDMNNYNFFPPLLYQVAAGFMEPSSISYPFRRLLRKRPNTRFRMGILQAVVPEEKKLVLSNGELHYDLLIMATGAESNFFGNGFWLNMMLLIICLLNSATTSSFSNRSLHAFGDMIGIHNNLAFDMTGGTANCLHQSGLGTQKTLFVGI